MQRYIVAITLLMHVHSSTAYLWYIEFDIIVGCGVLFFFAENQKLRPHSRKRKFHFPPTLPLKGCWFVDIRWLFLHALSSYARIWQETCSLIKLKQASPLFPITVIAQPYEVTAASAKGGSQLCFQAQNSARNVPGAMLIGKELVCTGCTPGREDFSICREPGTKEERFWMEKNWMMSSDCGFQDFVTFVIFLHLTVPYNLISVSCSCLARRKASATSYIQNLGIFNLSLFETLCMSSNGQDVHYTWDWQCQVGVCRFTPCSQVSTLGGRFVYTWYMCYQGTAVAKSIFTQKVPKPQAVVLRCLTQDPCCRGLVKATRP